MSGETHTGSTSFQSPIPNSRDIYPHINVQQFSLNSVSCVWLRKRCSEWGWAARVPPPLFSCISLRIAVVGGSCLSRDILAMAAYVLEQEGHWD